MSDDEDGTDFRLIDEISGVFQNFTAGEKVFASEEEGDCMYVVRSGAVEIRYYGVVVDRIGPGGIFGEIALIDGSTRSASAIAVEDAVLTPITRDGFLTLVQRRPTFALDVMKALTRRIRGMNESM